jgi:hypothetical protein
MAGSSAIFSKVAFGGDNINPNRMELLITWIADSANASVPTVPILFPGWRIERVVTKPGSPAPAAYTLTFVDILDGYDIMANTLAGRSATLAEAVVPAGVIRIASGGFTWTHGGATNNNAQGYCRIMISKT